MPCFSFNFCSYMMESTEQRRRQFAFTKNRSLSAPSRKRWYHKGFHRHHEHDLYDKVIARKLVDTIEMWHEFHTSLTHLAMDRNANGMERNLSISKTADNLQNGNIHVEKVENKKSSWQNSQITLASSEDDMNSDFDSEEEYSDDDQASSSGSINGHEKDNDDDTATEESLDTIEEIVKFEKKTKLNGKLSISNPDLTNRQINSILPKLQKHWK